MIEDGAGTICKSRLLWSKETLPRKQHLWKSSGYDVWEATPRLGSRWCSPASDCLENPLQQEWKANSVRKASATACCTRQPGEISAVPGGRVVTWLLSPAWLAGWVDFAGRWLGGWTSEVGWRKSESRPFGREQHGNICLDNLFVLVTAAAIFLKAEDYRTGKPVPWAEDIRSRLFRSPWALGATCLLTQLHSEQRWALDIVSPLTAREAPIVPLLCWPS